MSILDAIDLIEATINTKRKRHIVGGILLSASFFFGGLALTIMTTNLKEIESEESNER